MNLKQLEAFVKVAEEGSFSGAARVLFLSQPTISAHISELERELGARLFVRNTREVCLSAEGEKLYQYAHQMMILEENIKNEFRKGETDEAKCISIAASSIPGQYLLPDILAWYRRKNPETQFRITETDSAGVVRKIAEHGADVGFNGTVLEKKNCCYIPFYMDELTVLMPNTEKYERIRTEETTLAWMAGEPVILREKGSGTRREAERILKKAGILPDQLNIVACIENTEAIKNSVRNGMGITILSRLAAREYIDSGQVLEFSLGKQGKRKLNLVYNKNCPLSHSVSRFIRAVRELYQ